MHRVLLTGAGGAIGAHVLAHIMHNTDWELVATDSFRHKGTYDRITRFCRNHEDWPPRITIVPHDLCAPLTPRQIEKIGEIDFILHLASLSDVQDSIDNPVPFIRNNVESVLNILEYARVVKPKAFVLFSTDEVYGPATIDGGHREWEPFLPSNPYAASKASQEVIAISYWRSFGVPLIITNTMNNFGETQAPSKFTAMIQKRLQEGITVSIHTASDGQIGTRYYLHSRNAADALLFLLTNTTPTVHRPGHIDRPDRYNIVGDRQLSNLELAQIIASMMDKDLQYELVDFHSKQPGHDLHYGLDGTKLAELGWKAPVAFEVSMRNTIDWQLRNPEWLK